MANPQISGPAQGAAANILHAVRTQEQPAASADTPFSGVLAQNMQRQHKNAQSPAAGSDRVADKRTTNERTTDVAPDKAAASNHEAPRGEATTPSQRRDARPDRGVEPPDRQIDRMPSQSALASPPTADEPPALTDGEIGKADEAAAPSSTSETELVAGSDPIQLVHGTVRPRDEAQPAQGQSPADDAPASLAAIASILAALERPVSGNGPDGHDAALRSGIAAQVRDALSGEGRRHPPAAVAGDPRRAADIARTLAASMADAADGKAAPKITEGAPLPGKGQASSARSAPATFAALIDENTPPSRPAAVAPIRAADAPIGTFQAIGMTASAQEQTLGPAAASGTQSALSSPADLPPGATAAPFGHESSAPRATPGVPAQLPVHVPAGQRFWAEEVGSRLVWMSGRGESTAELVLTPSSLGKLAVSIRIDGDQASAQFVAATTAARETLEQALPRLREVLQQAGINLGHADVSTSGDQQARDDSGTRRGAARRLGAPGEIGRGAAGTAISQWQRGGNGLVDTFA
ncbi:MAG TPA: flagellar hook-length control protein FliK [Rhodocyclaceae bacterium]|nr:flagellar hook-length control protein FliK [Rhodocyclaceae bacterium]